MTEEEFKKTMKRVVIFIVIALVILVVIGIIVFGTSKKETSIFESQAEIDNYHRRVKELNTHEITEEDLEKLEEGEVLAEEASDQETEGQQPEEIPADGEIAETE